MGEWLRFFLGTPRRLMVTLVTLGLATVMVFPGILRAAVDRFVAEVVNPLLGPALTILIVFVGLRMIVGGPRNSRNRHGH